MRKLTRFWVTSNGKARGGWIVASFGVDKDGKVFVGPKIEGIATKKEAKRMAANLNQELQNSKDCENEVDVTITVNVDSVKNKRTAARIPGKFNASLDAAHSICRKHGVGKYGIRAKIIRLLQSTFGFCDDDCHRWLRTPHDDLGGRTPKEVVEDGKGQTVIDMLEAAKAGQPS